MRISWKKIICLCCVSCSLALPAGAAAKTDPQGVEQIANSYRSVYDDARMLSLAAGACAGTYVPGGRAAEFSYLGEYGWKIVPYVVKDGEVEANFMVATDVLQRGAKKVAVMAFRGSASLGDWRIDLTTSRVRYGGKTLHEMMKIADEPVTGDKSNIPLVHRGFNNYVMTTFKLLADIDGDGLADGNIAQKLKDNPDLVLLLTGHSLGGAAATLFAERLVDMGVPKDQVPVITFGAPAIGNKAFATAYGDKIDLERVVTSYDPVPQSLQKIFGGYQQFGEVTELKLSNKHADFQHPIAFYYDLAMKHYYQMCDDGIAKGVITRTPNYQLEGQEPLVAVVVAETKRGPDQRFAPDVKRFIVNEYKSLFPRYVIVTESADVDATGQGGLAKLMEDARAAGAEYLVFLQIDRHPQGQTKNWYLTIDQGVFRVDTRGLVSLNSVGTKLSMERGVMQSTIRDMEACQNELRGKLSFLNTKRQVVW